jgi:hypothetical protein
MDHIGDYEASVGEVFVYLGYRSGPLSPLGINEDSGKLVKIRSVSSSGFSYRYRVVSLDGPDNPRDVLGYFELGFLKHTSLEDWM